MNKAQQKRYANLQNPAITSIDIKHSELLDDFYKIDTILIPKLEAELNVLKKKGKTTIILDEKLDIRDRIRDAKIELRGLKNKKKVYLLDNSKFVFDYFEQKKQISVDSNIPNQNKNTDRKKKTHEQPHNHHIDMTTKLKKKAKQTQKEKNKTQTKKNNNEEAASN